MYARDACAQARLPEYNRSTDRYKLPLEGVFDFQEKISKTSKLTKGEIIFVKRYTAVISCEAEKAIDALRTKFDVITLLPDETIDVPVSCHADMILFSYGNKAVLPFSYAERYPSIVEKFSTLTGLELCFDSGIRKGQYPNDVGLNVLLCRNIAFSLTGHTSEIVKSILRESGVRHVNVKQGYSACSALSFGNAVITADTGIEKAASLNGLDTLLISKGGIHLEGYSDGFIGGASGVCGKTVYFLGNIDSHPDAKNIRSFIKSRGYECVSLFDGVLLDFGGIRFFENKF